MTIQPINDVVTYTTYEGWTWQAPMVVAIPPAALMTDSPDGFPRLRVDNAQTGFFAGREFRAFHRFSIAAGATQVYRFTATDDFILFDNSITLEDGHVWFELVSGGTAGGTFTSLPSYRRNGMSGVPAPASNVTVATGGTYTGGTVVDTFPVRTSGAFAQGQSVGGAIGDERGLAAGTYYVRIAAAGMGTSTGVISWRWENR